LFCSSGNLISLKDIILQHKNEREIKALCEAGEELQCSDLSVITWDQEEMVSYKKCSIALVPLWKWLLRRP
jgi:predicted AAA+ superfamily ATPase